MDSEEEFIVSMGRGVWIDDDPDKISSALDRGFDPNYNDNDGATTLHRVAEAGCVNAMTIFLEHPITRTDVKDYMQRTPLHYAVRCKNFEAAKRICDELLAAGLDINAESVDVEFPTPLFLCAKYMNTKLAAYFLENGADIDIQNFCEVNILHALISETSSDCDSAVLEEMIALLLYYNVDVNFCINYPHNHPMYAAFSRSAENHKIAVIMQLQDHFVNYNVFKTETYEGDGPIAKKLDLMATTFTILSAINLKLESTVILDLVKKVTFDFKAMKEVLMGTSNFNDLALFEYCLTTCEHLYNTDYTTDLKDINDTVSSFFTVSVLNKANFLTAIERLFNSIIATEYESSDICHTLFVLFHRVKPLLKLPFEDVEIILYQMLPYLDILCVRLLSQIFDLTKFSGEFEILLANNPLVLNDLTDMDMVCEYCRKNHRYIPRPSTLFLSICNPKRIIEYVPTSNYNNVASLQWLSRDIIRKSLRTENSTYRRKPCHLFSYYNEIRKLQVPNLVKDIITLKHVLK